MSTFEHILPNEQATALERRATLRAASIGKPAKQIAAAGTPHGKFVLRELGGGNCCVTQKRR